MKAGGAYRLTALLLLCTLGLPSGDCTTISMLARNALHQHEPKPGGGAQLISEGKLGKSKLTENTARPLCSDQISFSLEDSEITSRTDAITAEQLEHIMNSVDTRLTPHTRIRGSDIQVLKHAISEYEDFLTKLQPHIKVTSILEGGGNIGIATMIFAHMFPDATIVVLEPQPQNCLLLKANTLALPNVRVQCRGMWNRITHVKMLPGGDNLDWGWRIEEVRPSDDAVRTTTVANLLREHRLEGFDFVKLDIEGAEHKVLGPDSEISWLYQTKLLVAEVHPWGGGTAGELEERLLEYGLHASTSGEYTIFAKSEIHDMLADRQ